MAFRTNSYQQLSFTDSLGGLTSREQKALERSWAKVFAEDIFPAINEEPFRVLYSSSASRPNTPVNVCIGALTDQIYRTRENRSYCKEHGIRLSGPKLGRPSATAKVDKKQEYQDNTDRIEVERTFSLSKRCYGMSCITTKLEETHIGKMKQKTVLNHLLHIAR